MPWSRHGRAYSAAVNEMVPGIDPLREYREPGTDVRVIYYATALGTIVAYFEG